MSMNKYNLFNLYKFHKPNDQWGKLFQKKWIAKRETRAYHGEHLTESRWKAIFSHKLTAVAQLDSIEKIKEGEEVAATPISLQTYAVLEKRLDIALFRAMFASSSRQARQFILHGHVHVNGVRIVDPNFELKAGDVFSCNPEKVLEALAREKPDFKTSVKVTEQQIAKWNSYVKRVLADPQKQNEYVAKYLDRMNENKRTELVEKFKNKAVDTKEVIIADAVIIGAKNHQKLEEDQALKSDIYQVKYAGNKELCDKLLAIYNTVVKDVFKGDAALVFGKSDDDIHKIVKGFLGNQSKPVKSIKQLSLEIHRSLSDPELVKKLSSGSASVPKALRNSILTRLARSKHVSIKETATDEEAEKSVSIKLPFQKHLFGRQDIKKPYFTPWQTRPFIGPFAILPHHLEISFPTCHAVYLRDPVARPGASEVISPFGPVTHERAYMYYTRNA